MGINNTVNGKIVTNMSTTTLLEKELCSHLGVDMYCLLFMYYWLFMKGTANENDVIQAPSDIYNPLEYGKAIVW